MVARRGFVLGAIVTFLAVSILIPVQFAGASANAGVTSTTIKVGIPYLDLSSLASLGVKLNQGNAPHDYDALIANLNKHGGVNGRKVVATVAGVNPASPAQALSVCTQLTEDVQVFVALTPYMANCYLEDHGTPTINGTVSGPLPAGSAVNFAVSPPQSAYDPLQLSVFSKMGLFKGKVVGVFSATADQDETKVVLSTLHALHVKVAQQAVDSAPTNDQAATNQQVATAAQRFQSAGVTEVVAVGSASGTWPGGLYDTQSSFNPPWIATDFGALQGYIGGTTGNTPTYLKNVTSSSPTPDAIQQWQEPAIKNCVRTIRSAYPSDVITPPSATSNTSDHSYIGAIYACQSVALFEKIASAAGKNLTVASFDRAGYALRNVTLPGVGSPVSFGPGRSYGIGPVYIAKYNMTAKQLVLAAKSSTS